MIKVKAFQAVGLITFLALALPSAAGPVVVTFDDPIVTPGAQVYEWDYGKDGTAEILFADLTAGFYPYGPGPVQKYVNEPGLEAGIIAGPEMRIYFVANYAQPPLGWGPPIAGPFSFGFAMNTTYFVPLAVTFSIYGEGGVLLGATSASAVRRHLGGGVFSTFSEGLVTLPNPPVRAIYAEVDFNHLAPATRFFFDNFAYVPEPATWAMLIAGFGMVGLMARRRRLALA